MLVLVLACLEIAWHKAGLKGQEYVCLHCDCFTSGGIKDENSGLDSQLKRAFPQQSVLTHHFMLSAAEMQEFPRCWETCDFL